MTSLLRTGWMDQTTMPHRELSSIRLQDAPPSALVVSLFIPPVAALSDVCPSCPCLGLYSSIRMVDRHIQRLFLEGVTSFLVEGTLETISSKAWPNKRCSHPSLSRWNLLHMMKTRDQLVIARENALRLVAVPFAPSLIILILIIIISTNFDFSSTKPSRHHYNP